MFQDSNDSRAPDCLRPAQSWPAGERPEDGHGIAQIPRSPNDFLLFTILTFWGLPGQKSKDYIPWYRRSGAIRNDSYALSATDGY